MDPFHFRMFRLRGLDQPWVQECIGSRLKTGPYIHYESRDPAHANSGMMRNWFT